MAKFKVLTIDVICAKCGSELYRYRKEAAGSLVKCYKNKILKDHTVTPLHCPGCNQEFAREAMIHGRPAHKIIGGKVIVRGHH